MRCKACDSILQEPKWNRDLKDWELCGVCLEIAMAAFEDTPDDNNEQVEGEVELIELDDAARFLQREEGKAFGT